MPAERETEAAHNPLFDRIVGDDTSNLTRLVAYALYKKRKRDFLLGIGAEGRAATPEEISTFTKSALAHLDAYTNEAEAAMSAYAYSLLHEERPNIEKEAVTGRIESAVAKLEGGGTFLRQIGVGIIVWILSLFILLVIAWAAARFGIDIIDVFPRASAP